MSKPAFRMRGDRFTASEGYGVSPFGTAPFGGSIYSAQELPTYHLGSDDLQQDHNVSIGEIVHYRHGIPVSVRVYGVALRKWKVNFAVIDESSLAMLKDFFTVRVFDLLQFGNTGSSIRVHWLGTSFRPAYLMPGKYSLSFSIQEYPEQ